MIVYAAICLIAIAVIAVVPIRGFLYARRRIIRHPVHYIGETAGLTFLLIVVLRGLGISAADLGVGPSPHIALHMAACTSITVGIDLLAIGIVTLGGGRPSLQVSRPSIRAGWGILVCAIGAVWEELFFRGFLRELGTSSMSLLLLFLLSCIVFGLQHLTRGNIAAVYSFFYGVLFFSMYLISNDLVAVAVAHAFGNIFTLFCGANWLWRVTSRGGEAQFDVTVVG